MGYTGQFEVVSHVMSNEKLTEKVKIVSPEQLGNVFLELYECVKEHIQDNMHARFMPILMDLDIEETTMGPRESGPGVVSKILFGDIIAGQLIICIDVEWQDSSHKRHVKTKGQPSLASLGAKILELSNEDLVFCGSGVGTDVDKMEKSLYEKEPDDVGGLDMPEDWDIKTFDSAPVFYETLLLYLCNKSGMGALAQLGWRRELPSGQFFSFILKFFSEGNDVCLVQVCM